MEVNYKITEDIRDTPNAQEVSLALWDLRSHRIQDLASAAFSLLSSQSFSPSSLPFLSSLDTAPHSTAHGRHSPSQLPFYKTLILAFSSLSQTQLPLLPSPLLHPVSASLPPQLLLEAAFLLRASETGEDRKQTPPLPPARRSWGLCWSGWGDVDGHREEHSSREEPPNLQALLKDSPTQPGGGRGGASSISTPSQKPSLSCLINRKYLLAGRREERGAVWKRKLAPSLLGGGPQLLASFSLCFIVGSSSRCWGPGRCPLPRLLARTGRWVLLPFVT